MRIQCKGLANLSDLSHCPTLKAAASVVRAQGQGLPEVRQRRASKEREDDRKLKKVRGYDRRINRE